MRLIASGQNHIYKYFSQLQNLSPPITRRRLRHLRNKCLMKLDNCFFDYELFLAESNEYQYRNRILKHFVRSGCGIEIGALHHPVQVGKGATVKYIDRLGLKKLREQYPELNKMQLVEPDIIADGETLEPIGNSSQDFVIANHYLEHCQNPILAIENMLRVLTSRGILFMSIPDKRFSFDVNRPLTPYTHLVRDYTEGPEISKRGHFEEWVRLVNKVTDDIEVERQINHLMEINYSIHFHVWTETEMIEFFLIQKRTYDFEFELLFRNTNEMIFVLKKSPQAPVSMI